MSSGVNAVAERSDALVAVSGETFTCERCEVTAGWAAGSKNKGLPTGWIKQRGKVHCLACRRDLAAEAVLDSAPKGTPAAEMPKLKAAARVEFEIDREADRPDGEIAKACGTSIAAVRKARQKLGAANN